MIDAHTPNELAALRAHAVPTTARYLLCCICSVKTCTTKELAEYVGMDAERVRKLVKVLEKAGVVRLLHRYKEDTLIEATFP